MEIAHPLFLMKLCPKFEISDKTVSKDYSLERLRRNEKYQNPLKHIIRASVLKCFIGGLGN